MISMIYKCANMLFKKSVHRLPRIWRFLWKSVFDAFFRQESFAGVHIVVRDTLTTFVLENNKIVRFFTLPAEWGHTKIQKFRKNMILCDFDFKIQKMIVLRIPYNFWRRYHHQWTFIEPKIVPVAGTILDSLHI